MHFLSEVCEILKIFLSTEKSLHAFSSDVEDLYYFILHNLLLYAAEECIEDHSSVNFQFKSDVYTCSSWNFCHFISNWHLYYGTDYLPFIRIQSFISSRTAHSLSNIFLARIDISHLFARSPWMLFSFTFKIQERTFALKLWYNESFTHFRWPAIWLVWRDVWRELVIMVL